MGNVVPDIQIDAQMLSRPDSESAGEYEVHDNQARVIDASSILHTKYGYDVTDVREYPTMTQGPWVITSEEDRQRDALGFTHPYLHRRLDAKLPDDPEEILPRSHVVNLMNVDSYRTSKLYYHIDYMDLSQYLEDHPDSPYLDEILSRASQSEEKEIP